ncbi:F-box protein CPR1-like [Cornus florida]|uniref:F-box protein CPR1-like n=1 Tax=Cornus florida TaxID=4283 RepID=UPI0028A127E7|nr:F-box protein CPR1-like [Cornus florida]
MDIFTRLPITTLVQMRCVCKSWYALINNPTFITTHTNRTIAHNTTPLLLLGYNNGKNKHYSTIDKSVTLSVTPDSHDCVLGFGFDSRTNDYKVVRIIYFRFWSFAVRSEVDVYELSTGLWRSIASTPPPNHMIVCCRPHVFVNGASHWITNELRDEELYRYLILSFDMGSEVFKEMMLPSSIANDCTRDVSIAPFGESLSLIHYDNEFRGRSSSCCVWVMKEYGVVSSWTKLFTVDLGGINRVLGFRTTGEVLVEKYDRGLVSYDPKLKSEAANAGRSFQQHQA